MSSKKRYLTYVFGTLAIGATLILAAPVRAENSTTIDQSTQPHLKSWSNIIPNASRRFIVLADFNSEAVLDRETGLVWKRSPEPGSQTWLSASIICLDKNVRGRKIWRLPSIVELASLIDPSVPVPGPTLPAGHPFLNVESALYWSATTTGDSPRDAWNVDFSYGVTNGSDKGIPWHACCVHGPMQESVYRA